MLRLCARIRQRCEHFDATGWWPTVETNRGSA